MKQLYKTAIVLLLMSNALQVSAQTVDTSLAAIFVHTLDSMKSALNIKSLSVALQLSDGAIWAGAQGLAAQSPPEEATPNHAYAMGSVTKTLTGACVLQLADEGLLSLDDSLHAWLDTFTNVNPNITIRQLLRHQSGIYNYTSNPNFGPALDANPDSVYALTDILETFVGPPIFQPGAAWSYCNTNYVLLGLIIETVSGQPYYQEIRDRLITPLNLGPIANLPHEPAPPQLAEFWFDSNGDGTTDTSTDFLTKWKSHNSAAGPAGAYYTTATEMARWMRAYMSGTLLSPGMMAQLTTTVNAAGGTKYGLGITERNFIGNKGYGHGGDIGYSANVYYFPEKDLSIAVMTNDGKYNSSILVSVIIAYLKAYMDWTPVTSPASEQLYGEKLAAYPNPFQSILHITTPDGPPQPGLRFVLTDARGLRLRETADDTMEGLDALPAGIYFLHAEKQGRLAGSVTVQKVE